MKKRILALALAVPCFLSAFAQRQTDPLDRGLVAVPASSTGIFTSWRVQADEYYGVTYNLYRDGTLIASGLTVSNYTDTSGSSSNTYQVAAVRNGVEQSLCAAQTPWTAQYLEIPISNVQATNGVTVWTQSGTTALADYTINDIALGDVDGDGQMDLIVKRKNQTDQDNLFPESNYLMFCQIEVYASSIDYGRLWWIDCGPNICYGADEQWDAVAFDWNEDGACEVLYRGGANTVIHHADGTTETIGDTDENIRSGITHTANMTFSNSGEEWLMYINGQTGYTYDYIEYPLPRGSASDWGDTYGHRSSKYFMGAPYLDGVNPFIFLGRGIYTKIDACTYRVNKSTNKLYAVGDTWHSYTNTGWYGQGYHNFAIADVDLDGRDEVVYGSMVLDYHISTGRLHGMASTSLGHGDASHTGDLDPYRKGLETFACNEDNPGYNYRNAATCEIYARGTASDDDGRSMAANVSGDYPGCFGASTSSGIVPLSYVQTDPYTPEYISDISNSWNGNTPYPMALNFRIYWDGDLLDETINGPGSSEGYLFVDKLGSRIYDTGHGNYETACINGTKKNPCATGDIFGDWREEIVMRSSDNKYIRIYTTNTPTTYRMPSLWYNPEYRQCMVWQTEGYNQPPHTDYFVGELEGLTQAPPPLTNTSRTAISSGSSITSAHNGLDVLISSLGATSETTTTVSMSAGAVPLSVFINAPTTIEGSDLVTYTESRHTWDRVRITGEAFSGVTNICKQGDAAAHLPAQQHTHTGRTDVWQGALICGGGLTNSPLWANLHTELFLGTALTSDAGVYKSIEMEYGSALYLTNPSISIPLTTSNGYAHLSVGDLTLKEGARVVFDVSGTSNADGDRLDITGLCTVRSRTWSYGPPYSAPVFEIRSSSQLAAGDYLLGSFGEMADDCSLGDIVVELTQGTSCAVQQIYASGGNYYLHLGDTEMADESYSVSLGSGNQYYIRNVATGQYMLGGSSWGTRAIAGEAGIDFTVTKLTSGAYTFDSQIQNSSANHYLNNADAPYVDGAASELTLDKVETGIYTISNGSAYLIHPEGSTELAFSGTDASDARAQWQFMTASDIQSTFSSAVPAQPGVATHFIQDPNFGRNDQRYSSWTWTWADEDNVNKNNSGAVTNYCVESYHSGFSISQSLSDLPNGTYMLRAQGFYRQDGSDNDNLPCLFAGSQTSTLPLLTTSESSMSAASATFTAGGYEVDPVVVQVTDGTLTIGVSNLNNASLWVIWDNMRLYYLGTPVTGDVNGDGVVNLADLTVLIAVLNGNDTRAAGPKALQSEDVNGDGQCTADDVEQLLKYLKNEL